MDSETATNHLKSFLGSKMKIELSDERILVGTFKVVIFGGIDFRAW